MIAGTDHQVSYLDATVILDRGVAYTGEWVSQSLNREDKLHLYSLTLLQLGYAANANTTISVSASGDGGVTWAETQSVSIIETVGSQIKVATIGFNVTGQDIRVRIRFTTAVLVTVLRMRPRLIKRGAVNYG